MLFAIPAATSSSLFAEGSRFEERLSENLRKSLKSIFLVLVPAVVALAAVGKWLLLVFGRGYSSNALTLLWLFCLSSLPYALIHLYSAVLRVRGKIRELLAIWGFIALGTLLGSYFLMQLGGIVGIGYAWLGAQLTVGVYLLVGGGISPSSLGGKRFGSRKGSPTVSRGMW